MHLASPTISARVDEQLTVKIQRVSHNISRKWQWRLYTISLVVWDLILTALSFRAAYFVRFDLSLPIFAKDAMPSFIYYQSLVILIIPFWFLIFAASGLYNRQNLLGGTKEYAMVFNASVIGMFMVISMGFLFPNLVIARGWLLLAWGFIFISISLERFSLRRIVYTLRQHGFFLSPALLVGANDEGQSLADQLLNWKKSGFHLRGFLDNKFPAGTVVTHHLRVLGRVDQLEELIKTYEIEEVILASSAFSSRDHLLDIFKRYGVNPNLHLRLSSGLYEIITTGLTVKDFAYVPLVGINQVRLTGADVVLKMMMDYAITLPGLILASPVLLLIALAIHLDSPGPIIHRRRVMGVNGRKFDAFKFRTMVVNGDEILKQHPELQTELEANHKLKEDPRITRVGKFLRKWSLDELPQLFNVLKGDMSLVGPRMISPEELDKYDQWDINLLTVRPGITGLWQVSGRSDISYEQRVRLDMHYVRNWSIWLDLQLLYQTIPAVLKRRGAY